VNDLQSSAGEQVSPADALLPDVSAPDVSLAGASAPDASLAGDEALGAERPGDPQRWELLGEKTVYDSFLTVKQRRYRLPNGSEADWDIYGVRIDQGISCGVTVLPLTPDGRVVAVRLFRAGPNQVVTNLPGGLVDPGEEPVDAGRRELLEETGYTCESIEVVGWLWESPASAYRKYVAVARGCKPTGQQDLDEFEDLVAVEFSVDEFLTELRTPGAMTGTDAVYVALDHAKLL
jgi:ADP-ribose pyrophosphatase